ncbi:hypothetical protein [Lentibacillus songyuanensis]|uniref:hypothetical protein n=1 Tax=Lentibacillus songyuanensis TaxID=3136161 RepID=UPI0031BB9E83
MDVFARTCRLCELPMESSPFMMCPACLKASDKVRHFITKHPHVSIEQIVQETHVPTEQVEKMVQLGWNKKDQTAIN